MDNETPSYFPTPRYAPQSNNGFGDVWDEPFANPTFANRAVQSPQEPSSSLFYPQDFFDRDTSVGKDPIAHLLSQIHPSSHIRNYSTSKQKTLAPRPATSVREQKPKSARKTSSGQEAKRQKVVPKQDYNDSSNRDYVRCDSPAGSQSECCSSCPDTPPCDESSCCGESDCATSIVAVPCYEPSCEKPVCSDPCVVRADVENHTRTTNWIDQQWDIPMASNMKDLLSTMNGGFEEHYSSTSASSIPSTPLTGNTMVAPFSPVTALPTSKFPAYSENYRNHLSGQLDHVMGLGSSPWGQYVSGADVPALVNCLWTGCEMQELNNQQQWLSHLHNSHIDPQMSYGCPVQGDACPPKINTTPMDHLEVDHGFDFSLEGSSYSCPAPACGPNETFYSPSMFHNHFDHAHGVPAQGSIQCRLETCNTTFVNPQDLMVHIKEHHKLPITLPADDELRFSPSAKTANILDSLPMAKPSDVAIPMSDAVDSGHSGSETVHACKWKFENDKSCGHVSSSEEDLQNHVKHKHLEQLDKASGYRCQWIGCDREAKRGEENSGFSQRGKLERHMATHTGFKCCSCDICGRTFSAEQSLRQHMLLHKGEKPWKCKYCGKGFPQQSACTIHERTHTKEKPLECAICGKKFSESSNLSKHRKIHGEKGLNSCDYPGCTKTFHRLDQLKRHRATHERQLARLKAGKNGVGQGLDAKSELD